MQVISKLYWKALLAVQAALGALLASCASAAYVAGFAFEHSGSHHIMLKIFLTLVCSACVSMVIILFVAMLCMPYALAKSGWREDTAYRCRPYEEYLSKCVATGWRVFKFSNPIVLPFLLLFAIVKLFRSVLESMWLKFVEVTGW